MDAFAAVITAAQAFTYATSVIKRLIELRDALRHGRGFLHDQRANVGHLQVIIAQLTEDKSSVDLSLVPLLQSIHTTVDTLLATFKQQKRRQLIILLVLRRAEVDETFASLERKKTLLILYLNTQNSVAIASLKTNVLLQSTRALKMPTHPKSLDSAYASMETSAYQSDPYQNQNGKAISLRTSSPSNEANIPAAGIKPTASPQQRTNSNIPSKSTLATLKNTVQGEAGQFLCSATPDMDVTHEENKASDKSFQWIGADSGMSSAANDFFKSRANVGSIDQDKNADEEGRSAKAGSICPDKNDDEARRSGSLRRCRPSVPFFGGRRR